MAILKYSNINKLKSTLLQKVERRLEFNSEYNANEDIIDDFLDSAITEIKLWRKLDTDIELLLGTYDSSIVNFVVESYNTMGIEGQSYDGNGSNTRKYDGTPLSRLLSSIPQRL